MSKIILSGYYGFANAGDEAMLTAIVSSLRRARPEIELTVLSGNPEAVRLRHKVHSLHRFNLFSFVRELLRSDLFLMGGGSILQDVTSRRSIVYYLTLLLLAHLCGCKYMLFAQGIGPIRARWARLFTSFVCRRAMAITVRDEASHRELVAMGVEPSGIKLTADAVFSLPQQTKERGSEILRALGVDSKRPLIALALRSWQGQERYSKEFAQASEQLRKLYKAQILLLPLQYPQDLAIAQEVLAQCQSTEDIYILAAGYGTQEYLSLIANCSLVIGMRLHALIFAALQEVPYLAVTYDPKVDSFVKSTAGVSAGDIESITAPDIVAGAKQVLATSPSEQRQQLGVLRAKAQENVEVALRGLRGARNEE